MNERAVQGRRWRARVVIVVVMVLPIVYVASYGPVIGGLMRLSRYQAAHSLVETLYLPITVVGEHSLTVKLLMQDYLEWCLFNIYG